MRDRLQTPSSHRSLQSHRSGHDAPGQVSTVGSTLREDSLSTFTPTHSRGERQSEEAMELDLQTDRPVNSTHTPLAAPESRRVITEAQQSSGGGTHRVTFSTQAEHSCANDSRNSSDEEEEAPDSRDTHATAPPSPSKSVGAVGSSLQGLPRLRFPKHGIPTLWQEGLTPKNSHASPPAGLMRVPSLRENNDDSHVHNAEPHAPVPAAPASVLADVGVFDESMLSFHPIPPWQNGLAHSNGRKIQEGATVQLRGLEGDEAEYNGLLGIVLRREEVRSSDGEGLQEEFVVRLFKGDELVSLSRLHLALYAEMQVAEVAASASEGAGRGRGGRAAAQLPNLSHGDASIAAPRADVDAMTMVKTAGSLSRGASTHYSPSPPRATAAPKQQHHLVEPAQGVHHRLRRDCRDSTRRGQDAEAPAVASANSTPYCQIPTAKSLRQPGGATAIAAAGNGSHRPIAQSAHAPNPASLARVVSDREHNDAMKGVVGGARGNLPSPKSPLPHIHEQNRSRLDGHPPPLKPPGRDGCRHQQNQGQQIQDEVALKLIIQSCSQVFAPPVADTSPATPALQALAGLPRLRREDLGQSLSAHTPETITTSQHPQPVLFDRSDQALGRLEEAGVGAGGRGGAPKGKASKWWCDEHRRLPDSKLSTAEMDPKLAG